MSLLYFVSKKHIVHDNSYKVEKSQIGFVSIKIGFDLIT